MENRRKLLVGLFLIAGVLVMVVAFVQNFVVGYPIGLALALLGSVFWLCAGD